MNKWKVFLLTAVAVCILQLPYIGLFFQAANTLVHESGHALATWLANGRVQHIHLFSNTEGVTLAAISSQWGQIVTGLSGYTFASLFACLLAWIWYKQRTNVALVLLLTLSVINLFFWMRNVYGIVWVLGFMIFLLSLLLTKNTAWKNGASFVLLVMMVIDSIRSSFTVALISLWSPERAGDAALLEQMTFAPAAIWGILFFVQALFFGGLASIFLLSSAKRHPSHSIAPHVHAVRR